MPDPTIHGLVVADLAAHPPKSAGVEDLVLAAFAGPAALTSALAGAPAAADGQRAKTAATLPGTYLSSLEVEGFRGIGQPVKLTLPAGPGLTLVVGRNGSGKSSLAEALEMLLTGSNRRWAERPRVWTEGWRNLHHRPARITATFAVDGRVTPLRLARTWSDGEDVAASSLTIDGKRATLADRGWDSALARYPPLLSHNELGKILEGRPTELYDALASILGLADIAAAEGLLRTARLASEKVIKDQQGAAEHILAQVGGLEDERAATTVVALTTKSWDLAALHRVVAGGIAAVDERTALRTLRELSTLPIVDRERVAQVITRLRQANDDIRRAAGSDAATARDTALLLEQALKVHPGHEGDCPVCGTEDVLTYGWRMATNVRIRELREQAASVEQVHRSATSVRAEARQLLSAAPTALHEADSVGIDAREALAHWQRWSAPSDPEDLLALGVHLDTVAGDLGTAIAGVRAAASAELERREDRWRPAARLIMAWLPGAEQAETQRALLPRLKAAEAWVKEAHERLRAQRFHPIAAEVQRNWRGLRQSSSVMLGDLRLEGTGASNLRRLTLDVSIDGESGSALGVMSQGELNCLALSLFLPRASMPESPFRFLVIDDPVQALDPVKVEGLARVLDRVAQTRQVLVFTHDDRLPEAARRLEMDATIIEVQRRENSVVELIMVLDPVTRHIDDAMAVAMSGELPAEARRVVPGFCRYALEAACQESITRRMLHEGKTHTAIENALQVPTKLTTWLALALLGDAGRAGDVMPLLNQRYPWAADAVGLANRGSHNQVPADLVSLVRAAERLCESIRGMGGGGRR